MTDVATIDHVPSSAIGMPPAAERLIDDVSALLMPGETVLPAAGLPVPARLPRPLQRRPLPRDLAQPAWPIRLAPETGRLSADTARRVLAANILNTAPSPRPARPWRPDAWSVLCGSCGTVLALVIVAVVS